MSQAKLLITHRVTGDLYQVFGGFTRQLFEALAPKFPPSRLVRYDGNAVGDIIHIQLGIKPFTQEWVSEITAHECHRRECFFIDVGRRLPWPLTQWRHKHYLEQVGPGEVDIVEDITFATNFAVLTAVVRPFIRLMFEARGPNYRRYFAQNAKGRQLDTEPTS